MLLAAALAAAAAAAAAAAVIIHSIDFWMRQNVNNLMVTFSQHKNMSAEAAITSMGFSEAQARQALAATGGNIEAAINWSVSMCPSIFFLVARVSWMCFQRTIR